MKLVVMGTRLLNDENIIKKLIKKSKLRPKEIISNGEVGAGFYAEVYARKNNKKFTKFNPTYLNSTKRIKADYKLKEMIDSSDGALIIRNKRKQSDRINEFLELTKKKNGYQIYIRDIMI